jgi:hypothetical protein
MNTIALFLFVESVLDGVAIWCGSFLNREEREVRKDLMAFLRGKWIW